MLLIPAEKRLDWKRPPVATLGLMLMCLLVFVFYQSGDDEKFEQATEAYLAADLMSLEAPAYEDYLQRQIEFEGDADRQFDLEQFRELRDSYEDPFVAVVLLTDRDFFNYLERSQDIIWTPAERQHWNEQRMAIEQQYIRDISSFAAGLIPAEMSLYTLITYQFLHGGWGHIIGNLLFLFLLGFTVEKALGPIRFVIAYLICGVVAGLAFSAFSWGSSGPLVGASGSISGLMGMYVAIFGLRQIRFFYFLFVYFNYFRAPAIAMFPVWLGKELYDYWFAGATGIAYMAHAGGLVAGAILVWLLGKSWMQVQEEFFEPEQEEQDARFTSGYAQAMGSLGRMEFDTARRQFEALRARYPDRPILLEHLYQIAKLRPDLPEYRKRAREMMDEAIACRQTERMVEIWQEYLSKGEVHLPLNAKDHNRVLFLCLKHDDLKAAEKAFERLSDAGDEILTSEACRLLVAEFEKRQMGPKASHYRQVLQAY